MNQIAWLRAGIALKKWAKMWFKFMKNSASQSLDQKHHRVKKRPLDQRLHQNECQLLQEKKLLLK